MKPPLSLEERKRRTQAKEGAWRRKNFGHRSVGATWAEWERWEAACERAGIKMATWMRYALNRQCDLEEAMMAMEATEREKGLLVDRTPGEEP